MDNKEKTRENAIRRQAKRLNFMVKKSRERYVFPQNLNNYGKYMLVDPYKNIPVYGFKYDATLDEIENYLKEYMEASVNDV